MASNPTAFILLQDKVAYTNSIFETSWSMDILNKASHWDTIVTRGELLERQHKYNYVLQRDPSVFLRCADKDVAPLYTLKEFLLMEGIVKPIDGFDAFTQGMIDFGSSLTPGNRVFAAIDNEDYVKKRLIRATIQYIGKVQGYQGFLFGVELQVSVHIRLAFIL